MTSKENPKGPQFVRYFIPLIDALKTLDGSGNRDELKDQIALDMQLSDDVLNEKISSGNTRFSNSVDWARFYLVKAGYIVSSERGVWSLTELGRSSNLTSQQALDLYHRVQQDLKLTKSKKEHESLPDPTVIPIPIQQGDHRTTISKIIQELPPSGFERLCQRLLRESGFEKVTVTGRSGDGGLDGIGLLQVNPFVSFTVLFQSKRYSGSVSASQVRDFRGAMSGRTDKGIIITTGSFTADAKREAAREGVPPIELVDGEKLMDLFENLELGLKPKKAYDVDWNFFSEFK
jgi:restriction system protein